MLVLRRRAGESILVGDAEIEVIEVSRSRVKLGIRAPVHVPVIRKEALGVMHDNRMASELVGAPGNEGVEVLLRAIRKSDSLNERNAPPI